MEKLLVTEIWGLGDAVIMTSLLRSLPAGQYEVHLLCRTVTRDLLAPSYPDLQFICCDEGWSRFRTRYKFWRWNWRELGRIYRGVRKRRFSCGLSGRRDPRDHLFLFACRIPRRAGLSIRKSGILLTHTEEDAPAPRHRVEDWWAVGERLVGDTFDRRAPWLDRQAYRAALAVETMPDTEIPYVLLHCGAGQPIRRWPETYFADLITRLSDAFDFRLVVIPDQDGYGSALADQAYAVVDQVTIHELASLQARASLFLGNDSGPGHMASALGVPVVTVFGSQLPVWFRPFGEQTCVLKLEPAPSPPAFDQGGEVERRCLVELTPDAVWPQVHQFVASLQDAGRLAAKPV